MKKLLKDKRGSSLVLVLVTMTFLILLAGAVITMTITNIWLKASQKKSQENFYNTDSVLDSVAAGIQNESSKASSNAYSSVLSEYNASLTAADDSLTKHYTGSFLTEMVDVLSGGACAYAEGTTDYIFSDDVLKAYLTAEELPSYIGDVTGANAMVVENDSLILKNITVYKKEDTYETTLTTDIRVDVPLVSTDAHSEYLDYAILADDQILLDGNKKAVINGSIYSGTVNRDSNQVRTTQGIRITNGGEMTVNARYIISRGDLALADKGKVTISGNSVGDANVWVENITTDADPDGEVGENSLTITGDCYVSDDMELNGSNDTATLSGRYIGYNYNDDYSDITKVAVDASHSSAISINGSKNTLNFSGLNQLILAGRTFISKKTSSDAEATDLLNAGKANTDILLGESLTVKSSQLAYYVPDEYVKPVSSLGAGNYTEPSSLPGYGVVTSGSGPARSWLFFDVNGTTYAFDFGAYNVFVMPDDAGYQAALQGISGSSVIAHQDAFDVRDYIDMKSTPLKVYYRHDTRVDSDLIEYFYLNFDTSDGAGNATSRKSSIFYAVFHSASPQQTGVYDAVDERYLSGNGVLINESSDCILLNSGNILYSKPGQNRLQVKLQNTDPVTDTVLSEYAKAYSKEYMSRQLALIKDYSDANSSPLWRLPDVKNNDLSKSGRNNGVKVSNLFTKLVDESKLTDKPVEIVTAEGENVAVVVTTKNVTWPLPAPNDGVKYGLIITSGDVTVNGDFNGLILSGGDVNVGSGAGENINSSKKLMEAVVKLDKESVTPMFYDLLSQYFRKSVDATIGTADATDTNNVSFENWTKNE